MKYILIIFPSLNACHCLSNTLLFSSVMYIVRLLAYIDYLCKDTKNISYLQIFGRFFAKLQVRLENNGMEHRRKTELQSAVRYGNDRRADGRKKKYLHQMPVYKRHKNGQKVYILCIYSINMKYEKIYGLSYGYPTGILWLSCGKSPILVLYWSYFSPILDLFQPYFGHFADLLRGDC